MYYIGVDLGGTSIKAGVVNTDGVILYKDKMPTKPERDSFFIIKDMASLITEIISHLNISIEEVLGIGIGSPGTPDVKSGVLLYSNNLNFENVSIREELSKYFDIPVYLDNDANVAALAESEVGASKNVDNSVLVTLGTGIGGGIIIDNKIYSGFNNAGSELGHMIIMQNGLQCSCGQKGCFEKYASASALVSQTIEAAKKNPGSLINTLVNFDYDMVNARTVFEAEKQNDETAKQVIRQYLEYLSTGIINIINILFPEYIVIGGGLGNEGENLLIPLRKIVNETAYTSHGIVPTKIVSAKMGNDAGIVGAAMLVKKNN
ncbi:MAG: ROK family protein [Clostridia bacterium]|nr:ROK family protein [Clostridia bacterium]